MTTRMRGAPNKSNAGPDDVATIIYRENLPARVSARAKLDFPPFLGRFFLHPGGFEQQPHAAL
jgi:hypothetical protein